MADAHALNVRRTVRQFDRTGAAALHLEDQVAPKRCGHCGDQDLVSSGEMVGKIRAALEGRLDERW
jgi:2-methylisocitrate lyase-like PEP mutase family enzyme